ncbi:hypothetical protein D3C87_637240 [compost metagenome]
MKKSASVSLALIGVAGLLAGCEREPDIQTSAYENVAQCVDAADDRGRRLNDPAACEKSFREAMLDHQKNAPAFKDQKDCEEETQGKCEPTPSTHSAGGGAFMPFMYGYMMGRPSYALPENRGMSTPLSSQALYRSKSQSGLVNAGGDYVSNKTGAFKVSPRGSVATHSFTKPAIRTTTIGRGGFGGRSGGFGG